MLCDSDESQSLGWVSSVEPTASSGSNAGRARGGWGKKKHPSKTWHYTNVNVLSGAAARILATSARADMRVQFLLVIRGREE